MHVFFLCTTTTLNIHTHTHTHTSTHTSTWERVEGNGDWRDTSLIDQYLSIHKTQSSVPAMIHFTATTPQL